ncbi:unnamed protein product [Parnassius apollo]|uniref:(apollo) hypothetical protein n=1 Tax=Parnassius apollo TaxID=110799 RepID=A0A8S3XBG5_PARAO|nr:unnamed protein product [Parnassius apollo]
MLALYDTFRSQENLRLAAFGDTFTYIHTITAIFTGSRRTLSGAGRGPAPAGADTALHRLHYGAPRAPRAPRAVRSGARQ